MQRHVTGVAKAILAALSVDKIIYYVEHAETIYANVFNFKFHSNILYLLYIRRPFWSSWHYFIFNFVTDYSKHTIACAINMAYMISKSTMRYMDRTPLPPSFTSVIPTAWCFCHGKHDTCGSSVMEHGMPFHVSGLLGDGVIELKPNAWLVGLGW